MQFKEFLEYRNQFELSQQARIETKLQQLREANDKKEMTKEIEEDQDEELSKALGIPFLRFDMMNPR